MIYLMNLCIVVLFLVTFEVIGKRVNKIVFKNSVNINLPMGFVVFLISFGIVTIIPILTFANFQIVKFILLFILSFLVIISFYIFIRFDFKDFISRYYNNKFYIIVDVFSLVIGILLLIYSKSLIDSHVYTRMASIQNYTGFIYSIDGVNMMQGLGWTHFTESYYLFQSILADISLMSPYMYCTTIFKFLEGFIFIQMLGYLSENIIYKRKLEIFFLSFVGLLFSIVIFVPYELELVKIFLVDTVATGTLLLYMFFIPFIFILISQNNNFKNRNLLILILMFFGFSISSSMLFIYPFLLFTLIIMDLFIFKNRDSLKTYYITSIFPCIYFITYFFFDKMNIFVYFSIIIFITLFFIYTSKYFKYKVVNNIYCFLLLLIYLFINIYILFNKNVNIVNMFDFIFLKNFTVFYGLGIYFLYKKNMKLCIFLILSYVMIANPFVQPVFEISTYHRVAMLYGTYIFNIVGFVFIINFLFKNKHIKSFSYMLLIFYGISINGNAGFNKLLEPMNFSSFEEFKINNTDVYSLKNYNFEIGDSIYIDEYEQGTNDIGQIYMVVPYLNYKIEPNEDFKYKILKKSSEEDTEGYEIVYETDGYYLYKKVGR